MRSGTQIATATTEGLAQCLREAEIALGLQACGIGKGDNWIIFINN